MRHESKGESWTWHWHGSHKLPLIIGMALVHLPIKIRLGEGVWNVTKTESTGQYDGGGHGAWTVTPHATFHTDRSFLPPIDSFIRTTTAPLKFQHSNATEKKKHNFNERISLCLWFIFRSSGSEPWLRYHLMSAICWRMFRSIVGVLVFGSWVGSLFPVLYVNGSIRVAQRRVFFSEESIFFIFLGCVCVPEACFLLWLRSQNVRRLHFLFAYFGDVAYAPRLVEIGLNFLHESVWL